MEKVYNIRYNTHSNQDSDRWTLIEDGKEILVSSIVITSKTWTSNHYIKELDEIKYHVTCKGVLELKDGVAQIHSRQDKSMYRHILKTISYRLLSTSVTVSTALAFGLPIQYSALLGLGEICVKPFLYFIHERMWFKIKMYGEK